MIYFVQSTDGGPVKIGHSRFVKRRVAQLEAHYGKPLAILATRTGGRAEEREIHCKFAHLRLRGRGRRGSGPEQFRPTSELMEFIGLPLMASSEEVSLMPPVASVPIITVKLKGADADLFNGIMARTHIPQATLVRMAFKLFAENYGLPQPPEF